MGRRKSRKMALEALYQADLMDAPACGRDYLETDTEDGTFARELFDGCRENLAAIDERIRKAAEHWDLDRMAVIDRNILRLGAFELMYRLDVPKAVCINEAVELAKVYSTGESGAFVNGILDRLRRELEAEARA